MKKLEEGQIIFKKETPEELFYVLGVKKETLKELVVSFLVLDKITMESKKGLSLTIKKDELSNWNEFKLV
jgi:hypothetical protein